MTTNLIKRMSVTLTEDEIKELNDLSKSQGISVSDAINKAIATEMYIRKHTNLGGKVLLKRIDDSIIEVVFR